MTDPDLAELRRLAEVATPGPWQASFDQSEVASPCGDGSYDLVCAAIANGATDPKNAAFIAAANPAAILALLDCVASAEAALEPFSPFGQNEDGKDISSGLMRDRVCDWFGLEDFDVARAHFAKWEKPDAT